MNVKYDRLEILPMMRKHFPSLPETISSDELHGFLDAQTGLTTPLDEENSTAFDRWRQELAKQKGLPVWGYNTEQAEAIKKRGAELKAAEDKRVAELPETLKALAKEAPHVTAEELLKKKP